MSLLVTGFGPFLGHGENPSGVLATGCGERFCVLEVSYLGVDSFLDALDPSGFDSWLALGLAAKASSMLFETVGANRIGDVADVLGEVHGPGVIDPTGPPLLAATLWHGVLFEGEEVKPSVNAGDYLCNYLLYRALRRFPDKRIGFMHVPPFSVLSLERQTSALRDVIDACNTRAIA